MDIQTNTEGYLLDLNTWNTDVAVELARRDDVILTPAHWEVINLLREFYTQYQASPAMRTLVNAMAKQYGAEKGNSIYLHSLFPAGAAKQANKFAGLPKPIRCI